MSNTRLRLFEGYGIEIEYMIVNRETLDVLPVADWLLKEVSGGYNNEVEMGDLAWSNELVMHVVELKTRGAAPSLDNLHEAFMKDIQKINGLLMKVNGMLMPGGMHPFMDPSRETVIWKHDNSTIYEAYNTIFNCSGHGWSNLQSVHINLPFGDDNEFARLHAAIRIVLPLIPALASSSPIAEGRASGLMDYRLEVYRNNQNIIPEIAGAVIPEPVFSQREYEELIFGAIYRAIAPHDPGGILQYEWLNSRGCIARFERNTIEIRLMDVQECPWADMAIISFISALVRALVSGELLPLERQKMVSTELLRDAFLSTIRDGSRTVLSDTTYPHLFGLSGTPCTASDIIGHCLELPQVRQLIYPEHIRIIDSIIKHGTLGERIMKALREDISAPAIREVYARLAACLHRGELFLP